MAKQNMIHPSILGWAEHFGASLGEAVARGMSQALAHVKLPSFVAPVARRGRPPGRPASGAVCAVSRCEGEARSKGLCSKHYQAARRSMAGMKSRDGNAAEVEQAVQHLESLSGGAARKVAKPASGRSGARSKQKGSSRTVTTARRKKRAAKATESLDGTAGDASDGDVAASS
jgi:hypothetical protein